jgi:methionyl-tRNA synthetase
MYICKYLIKIMKKFITTTLPYSNSPNPHMGHALEFIIGDAIARYFRNKLGGENVIFNIGLDEHGKKIFDTAFKEEKLILDYLDENEISWRKFCHKFEISFDNFYRTSDYPHYSKSQRFWINLQNKGLIYEKEYSGKYCVGCESFKTDKDLVDGKCPDHQNLEISEVNEKNYFFNLVDIKSELKKIFETNLDILTPKSKRTEVFNLIENLQDISISRNKEKVPWAVPVPGDSNQTMYVWISALLNYIFAAGFYSDDEKFEEFWENSVQIFGPDNIKFQSIIFQGLLLSCDIKNTNNLLCHGTILDSKGRKMSKTMGNVVDPIDQVEKYGIDAVKYYALAGLNIYSNSSWNEDDLVKLYNSHLADDYGNLLTRVVTLLHRGLKDNELVGDPKIVLDHTFIDNSKITNLVREQVAEIKDLWDAFRITEALDETSKLVKWCNKYINDSEPWKKHNCWWTVLLEVHYFLTLITELYIPLFPEKSQIALESLQEVNKVVLFPKIVL